MASTKAFTCQLTALFILAMYLGQSNGRLDESASRCLVQELLRIPGKLETVLSHDAVYEELARELHRATDFLFLGRGIHFPIALEGALKLKEISYIHAEGYPAGEMKHGPNALIDEKLPVVVLATRDRVERREPRALREDALQYSGSEGARGHRGGGGHARATRRCARSADHVIEIPATPRLLTPDSGDRAAAIAGVSHRRAARLRRGSAAQPGQERDRRVACRWQQFLHQIEVPTRGKGLYEITGELRDGWRDSVSSAGLLTVFVQHTSASLTIQENADPDVVHDLNAVLQPAGRAEDNRALPSHRRRRRRHAGPHPRGAHTDAAFRAGGKRPHGARRLAGHLPVRASRRPAPLLHAGALHSLVRPSRWTLRLQSTRQLIAR